MSSIELSSKDSGQEVHIGLGDSVVLRLPENPTTGVRWSFDELDSALELTSDRYEQAPGNAPGAATTRVLTLQSRSHGRAEVRLKRWQEWEGASSIDATWHCTVRIE